jgi:ATP-binding cassette subfamily C protein LapB
MSHLKDRPPFKLSAGEKRAAAIASVISMSPNILILDEPTSMMDMQAEKMFMHRLGTVLADKTMILITHRPTLLSLVNRVIILGNGKIVKDESKDDVLNMAKAATREQAAKGA